MERVANEERKKIIWIINENEIRNSKIKIYKKNVFIYLHRNKLILELEKEKQI